jgi:hypothetical protein
VQHMEDILDTPYNPRIDYEKYWNSNIEIEARNAVYRFKLSKDEKKIIIPISGTQDKYKNIDDLLLQGPKAAIQLNDVMDIIYALTNPNVSSPVHELAHKW